MIYGNVIGGSGLAQTFILEDESGKELVGVRVKDEVVLTATENDIRIGTVAATEEGITPGEKVIPAYHTTEGYKIVPPGAAFQLAGFKHYDYTKLQVVICAYNSTIADSVAAEKVCLDGKVYSVGSTEELAEVTIDSETESINLGIVNKGKTPCVMRYITYKEVP